MVPLRRSLQGPMCYSYLTIDLCDPDKNCRKGYHTYRTLHIISLTCPVECSTVLNDAISPDFLIWGHQAIREGTCSVTGSDVEVPHTRPFPDILGAAATCSCLTESRIPASPRTKKGTLEVAHISMRTLRGHPNSCTSIQPSHAILACGKHESDATIKQRSQGYPFLT